MEEGKPCGAVLATITRKPDGKATASLIMKDEETQSTVEKFTNEICGAIGAVTSAPLRKEMKEKGLKPKNIMLPAVGNKVGGKSRRRRKRGGRKSKRRSGKKARKSKKSKRRRGKKSKRRRRRK